MRRVRLSTFVLTTALLLASSSVATAQTAPPELPAIPDPTPVSLDSSATAFLVLDINSAVCPPRPACMASVPAISRLLASARSAGAFVGYSTTPGAEILPDVAPRATEPVVTSRADKFFNTDLDRPGVVVVTVPRADGGLLPDIRAMLQSVRPEIHQVGRANRM